MLNIGVLETNDDEFEDIHIDIDDTNCIYIKQGSEWVCMPRIFVPALVSILAESIK